MEYRIFEENFARINIKPLSIKWQQAQEKKEGEITIDKNPTSKTKPNKKDVGDYVDFEEVDE